jgi:N-acetylglucosamine-6-sulfatase
MERDMSSDCTRTGVRWLLLAAALAIGLCRPALALAQAPQAVRPNIVFILSDDEDAKIHAYMPKTKALLENHGTAFDNFFVSYSFCCPSRATILRGQYPHNTQIEGIQLPTGGFRKWRALGLGNSTIATWLHAAGYHTAFYGKYLNQYDPRTDGVQPGWDEWYAGGDNWSNYDYILNENGTIVSYGDRAEDYLTDVIARKAVRTIHEATTSGQPFFLYLSTYTPHAPATCARRHDGLFADTPLPRPLSFDEADVSDKPAIIRNLPPLSGPQIKAMEQHYRARLRSLQAIDDMVETVVETLEQTHQLATTYIIYTSDNGFHMGEHRMIAGKTTPYEEDIRVPAIVRGPHVPAGQRIDAMVLNNDFGPTFAAIAGVAPPSFVDGRSFLPLFANPKRPWRHSFLIQRRELETHEMTGPARFDAIRTADRLLVEYGDGDRELYDVRNDPYELESRAGRAEPLISELLSARLAELLNCAGPNCREIEDLPVDAERTAAHSVAESNMSSTQ